MMPVGEAVDSITNGAIIAAGVRWVFGFDVELHWVAAIGALSEVGGRWAVQHSSAMFSTWPEPVVAGVLGTVLLAGAHLVTGQ